MSDGLNKAIELMSQNGGQKYVFRRVNNGLEFQVEGFGIFRNEIGNDRALMSAINKFTSKYNYTLFKRIHASGIRSIEDVIGLDYEDLKKQAKMFYDIVLLFDDSFDLQLAILEQFNYSDGSPDANEKLIKCKILLRDLNSISKLKVRIISLGNVMIKFMEKLNSDQIDEIVEKCATFEASYGQADLPPTAAKKLLRADGCISF